MPKKKPAKKARNPAGKKAPAPKKRPAAKKLAQPKKVPQPKRAAGESISLSVTLRESLMPLDRGERYEDPLHVALEKANLGQAGGSGGTLCSKDGEIEEADFDLDVTSLDAIPLVTRLLEEAGAAKGGTLRYRIGGQDVVVPFGVTEEVAIYLDGVTLPEEVYKSTSTQELIERLAEALGDDLDCRGSWQGQRETALYFYGLDAEALFATMEPVLREYPLSRNARVVVRHRLPDEREVRLG